MPSKAEESERDSSPNLYSPCFGFLPETIRPPTCTSHPLASSYKSFARLVGYRNSNMKSVTSSFVVASLVIWQQIGLATSRRMEFTLVVHHKIVDTVDPVSGERISRLGTFVNGTYPGPTLEVQLGDDVEVKVVNKMASSGLTMHFHGQHMVNTYFHDGVHGITQCDISPGDFYVHRFKAEPAGTFIYHSHMPFQLADGGACDFCYCGLSGDHMD